MAKLVWDKTGEKFYETGVEMGVLYPQAADGTYPKGYAWDGLSSVQESPSGAEATAIYADNTKYLNLISAEQFGATVEAYQSPEEFDECDGTKALVPGVYVGQQVRKPFGMAYKTLLGNDILGTDYGYKIHIIYNAMAAPSSKNYATVNESPEAMTLSWTLSTTPITVAAANTKPVAHLVIESDKFKTSDEKQKLAEIEKALFGFTGESSTDDVTAFLPLPDDIVLLANGTKTAKQLMPAVG